MIGRQEQHRILMALDRGWDVLGLVSDTANSWALQASTHALALLEIGNLSSCIPVHKGADYPLLVTPKLMQAWQQLQGTLPWQGVFKPSNGTAEALGNDPPDVDPTRTVLAAFTEGFPNTTLAGTQAAAWMVDQVRKYPGEITIWAAGSLINVALAVRMDSEFASLTCGWWVVGGFVDVSLLVTSGDVVQADINTDFNFKTDPEATKIVLTSGFTNITLVSNAGNGLFAFPDEAFQAEITKVDTVYGRLAIEKAAQTPFLPYWDEVTAHAMLNPSSILNQTSFYVNVDTSYYSPTYGNIWVYQEALAPMAQDLRKVNFVYQIKGTSFRGAFKQSLQFPKSCL